MNAVHKVLIIDDEKPLLLGLSTMLKQNGYQVLTAENGGAGLQLAKQETPDIIICDVMMPPPNGFELQNLLSGEKTTASIPFIFMTAISTQEDKLFALRSGANGYISKPIDHKKLLARVESLLRRREIERGIERIEMALLA